jgi:hypothetical protein
MDINLTGQIFGMPVSLIGQLTQASNISTIPQNLTIVNQMAPSMANTVIAALSALFGALVGGSVTYLVAYKRQKYELRREAYLAFLELRIEGNFPNPVEWTKIRTFSQKLFLAKYKIDLVGSKRISEIASKALYTLYPEEEIFGDNIYTDMNKTFSSDLERKTLELQILHRWFAFITICDEELKPAIKEELRMWQPFDLHQTKYRK